MPAAPSAIESRLEELEKTVRALKDEQDILHTLYKYAHILDYGHDLQEWLDCFTENGVWKVTIDDPWAGSGGAVYQGRAELEAFNTRHARMGTPGNHVIHGMLEPQINVDGDRARATSFFMIVSARKSGPLLYSMGRYEDTLVRGADGRWRIEERHNHRECVHESGQAEPAGRAKDGSAGVARGGATA